MKLAATAALLLALTAPASVSAQAAHAMLSGPDGAEMGEVHLAPLPDGSVLLKIRATGITPGEHGFHIHETGACAPDFDAAGDHYAVGDQSHGIQATETPHAGDLPNIVAAEDGSASADVVVASVSLEEGAEATLFDDDGSAIIIHENADTYAAEAGAGGRVACGVIERM